MFEGFARVRYDVGDFGNGMRMKLVANLLVAIHNLSTAEAILLGARSGLDPAQVVRVVADGAGGSRMFQVRGPVMVQRGGMVDSCSSTERTKPVTVDSPAFTVAIRPLNWAMRKRRTSF